MESGIRHPTVFAPAFGALLTQHGPLEGQVGVRGVAQGEDVFVVVFARPLVFQVVLLEDGGQRAVGVGGFLQGGQTRAHLRSRTARTLLFFSPSLSFSSAVVGHIFRAPLSRQHEELAEILPHERGRQLHRHHLRSLVLPRSSLPLLRRAPATTPTPAEAEARRAHCGGARSREGIRRFGRRVTNLSGPGSSGTPEG